MIECEEVRKSFKNNIVIKNVNLKLNNGEITSLIGRNGAGKSTLINLIVGYYHLDSGRISKNSLSVMPDADNIYSSWTGLEFLSFMSKMKKTKLSEALAMADKLGLTPKIKTKISGYSFGMKKKLSFVQCAIGDYDAYIFDEPTSGVDVPSALVMLDIVKSLKERNAAVLLTSHNIDELERVSDYIYLLDDGKIIKEGTVNSFVDNGLEVVYYLVSPIVNEINKFVHLKSYFREIDESKNRVELAFPNEEVAIRVLKEIILQYPVIEYYRKREKLIEKVYEPLD